MNPSVGKHKKKGCHHPQEQRRKMQNFDGIGIGLPSTLVYIIDWLSTEMRSEFASFGNEEERFSALPESSITGKVPLPFSRRAPVEGLFLKNKSRSL
ncbi:hypothetical protein AVEN_42793-1 [Araneus ventricosus]|uniref:Uncharacterized protein n=1 Tax=Araneus ventricosus TaxID=182803 RepID=A0A4Y2AEE1_ARAVE|nr:hypothetical protein AVEN_42793-1 [Araneus ventricosus]